MTLEDFKDVYKDKTPAMDDLISRAAAVECAINAADDWDGGWNPNRETYIRNYFAELPAVVAAPVKHGRWVEKKRMASLNNPYLKYVKNETCLKDNEIINTLKRCASEFEDGDILEVKYTLQEIIDAIDEWEKDNYS